MRDRVIISLIALLFATAAPGWASGSGCTDKTPSVGKASGEGLKVYVDPETGELLSEPPSGEELQAPVESGQPRDPSEMRQDVRPDGTVVVHTGDFFMTELRVEIVDGKVVTCHRQAAELQSPEPGSENYIEKTSDDGR